MAAARVNGRIGGRIARMPEHTFSMADVRYVLLATMVIFVIELITSGLKRAKWGDFGITVICYAINTSVTRPLGGLLYAFLIASLLPRYAGSLSALPLWIATPLVLLVMEFGFYWMHRWSHEGAREGSPLAWIWKIHRTHHSPEYLDVSVTMRQNIFWTFVLPTSLVIGTAVYLGMGEGAALATLIIYSWNLLTHTHYRWDHAFLRSKAFRAFQHVIVSPSMHHSHHGYGANGKMYCNYCTMFAFYDWMFGTLYLPDGRPSRYGVPGAPAHWAEQVFYPLFAADRFKTRAPVAPAAD
jgi:sterol desaturase/sphingolipid hydroxylase (fatty acid hydroxylase superfamily)